MDHDGYLRAVDWADHERPVCTARSCRGRVSAKPVLSRKPIFLLLLYFVADAPSSAFSFFFACPFSASFSSAFL